ncbi:MAG: histidinol dehydrogenase [Verrucomicrobia bacterium]|nr:histidinol dehydrogenase [Verrucomicrobiota bacterium]
MDVVPQIPLLSAGDSGLFEKLRSFNDDAAVDPQIASVVQGILADVRTRGDEAVIEYTRRFDGWDATADQLRIPAEQITAAMHALAPSDRAAILEAIDCVESFHKMGLPRNWLGQNPHGAQVGERWYPIERVGIYVPAGNVPLVSTVVMTATLARLAGVPQIAVFTPAGKTGAISSQMLACLALNGISEVYAVGGAQAIAAMAFGTATIPQVCKVMGPGNAYVAEAQRQVFGQVGIDLLPGPSEALAYADSSADPTYLAADLLAQAEHGSGKEKIYLVSDYLPLFAKVSAAIADQLPQRKHAAAIRKVLAKNTVFVHSDDEQVAVKIINYIAPEHFELHVAAERIEGLLDKITTAGAILCGHYTPTVLGDFTAGPSHTLPTSRTGRFFSGLKITDFMRRSSIVQYNSEALEKARPVIAAFARLEDLDGHGHSMEIRFS